MMSQSASNKLVYLIITLMLLSLHMCLRKLRKDKGKHIFDYEKKYNYEVDGRR